ncbi:terminase TerL endonuclease subunit [uncultured Imperialibacter sp.]|uniref:terminase TerL endonuclease subunit n=1 Tax=uncultured Imperialibacter sp. TaxID=1672639 RepID=UPI0030D7730F|tara:strand:- start:12589 stop:14301 length:1713 start_codon:yes stop_codon:yes gene_type:complete
MSDIIEKRNEYIQSQIAKLEQYASGVESGEILANKDIKQAVKQYRNSFNRGDIEFRHDEIKRFFAFTFYARILRESDKKYIRPDFEPFQVFFICNLYGWFYKDTDEQFMRKASLFISKKNGKTTLSALLAAFATAKDKSIIDGSIFIIGQSIRSTTEIGFKFLKDIITHSPALKRNFRQRQYTIHHASFSNPTSTNTFKMLPASYESTAGLKANLAIIDEIFLHKDSMIYDGIWSGMQNVPNSLLIVISTRGFNTGWFMFDLELLLRKVLYNEVENDGVFTLMYGLDEEDNPNDSSTWIKANPGLSNPKFLKLENLKIGYNESINMPIALRRFYVYHLNKWVLGESIPFIPDEQIQHAFKPDLNINEFAGCNAVIGVDLARSSDLVAVATMIEKDGMFYFFIQMFFAGTADKLTRNGGFDLSPYIRSGEVEEVKFDVSFEPIFNLIQKQKEILNIDHVFFDPWYSESIMNRIKDELQIDCQPVKQGPYLSPAIADFRLLFLNGKIQFDNSFMKWSFRNVVLKQKGDNEQATKDKALDSIDGVIAMLTAYQGLKKNGQTSTSRLFERYGEN